MSIPNADGSELSGWPVTYTPVDQFTVTSLVNGVVKSSTPLTLSFGDAITFDRLSNPVNVVNNQAYYVASVNTAADTFTFSSTPGGSAIFTANADPGTGNVFFTAPTATARRIPTFTSGSVSLNPGALGWYLVRVAPKTSGYLGVPSTRQRPRTSPPAAASSSTSRSPT